MNYKQGLFTPAHPEKYKGRVNAIIYRSGWEKRCMMFFDQNPSVLEWSSEEIIISYICGTDNRKHNYYPDFLIKVLDKTGVVKTYLLEIKPESQCKTPRKNSKHYLNEALTYIKNQSKWKYAKAYAEARKWEFLVLTEKMLGI